MAGQDEVLNRARELRHLAEQLAKQRAEQANANPGAASSDETLKLVHDLQVHQIELELQNEALLRAQVELEAAQARYFDLYDQAPVGYLTLARDGMILDANTAAVQLLDLDRHLLAGLPLERFVAPPDRGLYNAHRERFLQLGEPFTCELRMVKRDGTPFWGRLVGNDANQTARSRGVPGTGTDLQARIILTDLTEAKRAEQERARLETQLRNTQRLESLSFLALGLAHEFNNLLGAMAGNLDLLRLESEPGRQTEERLDTVDALVARAANLVGQLQTFAGKDQGQMQTLDLNHQVEAVAGLMRSSVGEQNNLVLRLGADLTMLHGDPGLVRQAILNLAQNAAEAMGARGGTILLSTGTEIMDEADLKRRFPGQGLRPGRHLTLEVSDQGHGMPPEVQERIFDPFYSTRFAGRGLGLAVVHGILVAHQAGIRVDSEEGRGTFIQLLFPEWTQVEPARRPKPAPQPPLRGTGGIMVVEDETALRKATASTLRRLGFEPLEAGDGLEALQVYEANRKWIRMVLMDLTMPRMGGEEAYRALRRAGATVPIVLTSGFGPETALRPFRYWAVAGFLPKPFRQADLAEVTRLALAGRSRRPGSEPRVVWQVDLESGDPDLDSQHQILVQALNTLDATAITGPADRIREAMDQLLEVAERHFRWEERWLSIGGLPSAREHRDEHEELLGQLRAFAHQADQEGAGLSSEVLDFIQDWVMCHLQAEARQLARRLMTRGGH